MTNISYEINISSLGVLPTFFMTVFVLFSLTIYSLLFDRNKIVIYSMMIEFNMMVYLVLYFLTINASRIQFLLFFAKSLYITFGLLSVVSIYAISYISNEPYLKTKVFVIISTSILVLLTAFTDGLILTGQVLEGAYHVPEKGPLFILYVIYDGVLAFILIRRFLRLRISDRKRFDEVWPVHVGIIFFIAQTDVMVLLLVITPGKAPNMWINSFFFTLMIIIYLFKEVAKNLQHRENMYMNYIYDELSGVHSRSYIIELLDSSRHIRGHKSIYAAMIDIDGFKDINDSFGHLEGDHLIQSFGYLLNTLNPEHIHAGRLGGDEFILYCESLNEDDLIESLNQLLNDYQKLVRQISRRFKGLSVETGLSIGIYKPLPSDSSKEILSKVDQAMYSAKKEGKNTFRLYS